MTQAAIIHTPLAQRYNGSVHAAPPPRNFLRPNVAYVARLAKDIDKSMSLYYVTIGSIYSVAHGVMVDAHAMLRHTRHYRHETKRDARKAMNLYNDWERLMRVHLKGEVYQLWLDLSDNVYDQVRPDIDRLRQSILHVMQEHDEPEAELKAALLSAESICALASVSLDSFMNQVECSTGIDIRPMYSTAASFEPIYKAWHSACDRLLDTASPSETINLNDIPTCKEAMKALQHKLYDYATYNKAGAYSMALNLPDVQPRDMSEDGGDSFEVGLYNAMQEASAATKAATKAADGGHDGRQDKEEEKEDKGNQANTEPIKTNATMKGNYYEAKVKYMGWNDNGEETKKTGTMLVEAETMTEVETMVTKEVIDELSGKDVQLLSCRATKYTTVLVRHAKQGKA